MPLAISTWHGGQSERDVDDPGVGRRCLAHSFLERRGRHQMWPHSRRPLQFCGGGLVLGLAVAATWTNVPLVGGFVWGGWSMMRTTEHAAVAVERIAPRRPFTLAVVGGPASFPDSLMVPFGMESGVAYRLHVRGFQPRFTTLGWHYFGAWTRQVPNEPVVTIELPTPTRRECSVSRSHPARPAGRS